MADEKRDHQHHDGSSGRAFTIDQKAAVVRVRKCNPTAFYDILGLEAQKTTASDSEIKKAYRKLSLLTHPDKNGYQGADEAFKMVARAFSVLSDAEKKAKFDRFGGDPDSRFGGGSSSGASASPFSRAAAGGGAARRGGGGGMWEDEISPEDLFRQFFGGGGMGGFGGGGPFGGGLFDGGGPGFMFNMGGGPGIRVHQFGGGAPRRRPRAAAQPGQPNAAPPSAISAMQSLLPLLLLFILPLLSNIFSSSTPAGPNIRFDTPAPPYTHTQISSRLKIPYYLNPTELSDMSAKKWRELDKRAENGYVNKLSGECESEQRLRARMYNDAQGFFFTDQVKAQEARSMPMPACKRLNDLGYRTS